MCAAFAIEGPWNVEFGDRLTIRSARPEQDVPVIRRLFRAGRLEGLQSPDDQDGDLLNLGETYFAEGGGSHFWVAEVRPEESNPVESGRGGNSRPQVGLSSLSSPSTSSSRPMPTPTSMPTSSIIGTVGVIRTNMHTAEVKRLRVEPVHHHRGVGSRLMSVALDFCRELGYLKVVLDTRVERTQAIALFERFGFQLTRTRDVEGKQIHDFYLDLYRQRPEPERDSSHDEVQRQAAEQTHSKTQM